MKNKIIFILAILFYQACATIDSNHLTTTEAENLKIVGVIEEYENKDTASVSAQMQTIDDQIGINFDQGETLVAQSDTEAGLSESLYLSKSDFIDLDQMYEGSVDKTLPDGNYYLTYTDQNGVSTTATIPTFSALTITSPVEGATVILPKVTVTWNPEAIEGVLFIRTTFSTSNSSGTSIVEVENDGSEEIDISNHRGSGTIELVHENSFNSFAGFGESKIYIKNIFQVHVSFANET